MNLFAVLSQAFLPARLGASISGAARFLIASAAIFATTMGEERALAQTRYRFINIADSSGLFERFSQNLSINNHGVVTFGAFEDGSSAHGIHIGSGGLTSTIAHTSGPYSNFNQFHGLDVNDNGVVAFSAGLDGGGQGVFTSDGTSPKPLLRSFTKTVR